jgi:hypothetical protein
MRVTIAATSYPQMGGASTRHAFGGRGPQRVMTAQEASSVESPLHPNERTYLAMIGSSESRRHMQCSKPHRYSSTASAATSSLSGISRPSAFAVLRLSTSSNLADCTTGRSAGFSPLRMRPV